jgi:hypothetical protein
MFQAQNSLYPFPENFLKGTVTVRWVACGREKK